MKKKLPREQIGVHRITEQCPACGFAGGLPIERENHFEIFRCESCAHVYVWPPPDETGLHEYYKGLFKPEKHEGYMHAAKRAFPEVRALLEKECDGRQLLDIGCGAGLFVEYMGAAGWDAAGLDVDPEMATRAAAERGIRVHIGAVENVALTDEAFDAVTFWWVIEHLRDPLAALQNVFRMLKPGGVVWLRVPFISFIGRVHRLAWIERYVNLASLINPLSGKDRFFYLLQPPFHLHGFSRMSGAALLERAGFSKVEVRLPMMVLAGARPRRFMERGHYNIANILWTISRSRWLPYHDIAFVGRKP